MSKDSKKPAIRFKGFTDDWEQRELGSVFEKFTDGDWIESKDQSNEGIRLVQTGNVGIGEYIDKSDHAKWISESSFYKLKCKEIHEGDILISRLPDPAGRACIVPKLSTRAITAVDCTIAKASKDFDSKFILQFLCSSLYFSQVNTCLAGGTRQRISRTNLHNCEINLPTSSSEQIKIGEMLSRLDVSITLHQRKLDKLKNIKKALLEKMFSKDGCKASGKNLEKWCTLERAQNNKIYPKGTIYTALSASQGIAYQLQEDNYISDRYAVFVPKTSYINVFYEIFCESFDPFYQKYNQGINFAFDNFKFFDFQEITLSDNELQEMEEALKKINNLIDNEKLFIQQMKGFKDFCLNKMFC